MKDSYNRIQRLLHLYYSGLSSVAEENEIKQFYSSHPTLPDDLERSRGMFSFNSSAPIPEIPESARIAVSRQIDLLERQEQINTRGYRRMARLGIAAAVLIVASIGVFLIKNSGPKPYELTDPTEAYAETKRALLLVAESFTLAEEEAKEAHMILESLLTDGEALNDSAFFYESEMPNFPIDSSFTEAQSTNI